MSSNYAPRTRTSTGRSDPNSPVLLRVYFIALMLHDVCEFSEKKISLFTNKSSMSEGPSKQPIHSLTLEDSDTGKRISKKLFVVPPSSSSDFTFEQSDGQQMWELKTFYPECSYNY
jgi:hypothetical protein